jgi:fumarylacetoacetate (FAA) hydrolase
MKLASLRDGRDGRLVVVSRDLSRAAAVPAIAPTLQRALDEWDAVAPRLVQASARLERGALEGAFALDPAALAAPLPRAYQWADASAYLRHVELVRRARGAELPPELRGDPLMYQGGSDVLLGPRDPIAAESEDFGVDFEAEVAVVVGDVPMAASSERCARAIRLVTLVNDVSLRNLVPGELAKGFGFFHSKPPTAFAPVAVTADELGGAWDGARLSGELRVWRGEALFGRPDPAADMAFDFPALVAHAARTRPLVAGTIVGSGTVSNRDASRGSCCIAERRAIEMIERGAPATPFLRFGETVRIEFVDAQGRSPFGAIEQRVVRYVRHDR